MASENKPYGYIYRATNRLNGKTYIGQTVTSRWKEDQNPIEERWKEAVNEAYKKERNGEQLRYIENAITKYGPENFDLKEQDVAYSQEQLDEKEKHWINEYDTMNRENGYNLTEGGLGGRPNEELLEKMIKINREITQDPEYRKKMSESISEKWQDKVYLEKQIKERKERGQNPEFQEKVSKGVSKRWQDNDYQKKQIKERRERAQNPEWIKKMMEINREITQKPEYKEKMREITQRKWEDPDFQEKVSKGIANKWQEREYREKQINERIKRRKDITGKGEFLNDIKNNMLKREMVKKYEMSGNAINRRINEMFGPNGPQNYTELKDYLRDKEVNEVLKELKENELKELQDKEQLENESDNNKQESKSKDKNDLPEERGKEDGDDPVNEPKKEQKEVKEPKKEEKKEPTDKQPLDDAKEGVGERSDEKLPMSLGKEVIEEISVQKKEITQNLSDFVDNLDAPIEESNDFTDVFDGPAEEKEEFNDLLDASIEEKKDFHDVLDNSIKEANEFDGISKDIREIANDSDGPNDLPDDESAGGELDLSENPLGPGAPESVGRILAKEKDIFD